MEMLSTQLPMHVLRPLISHIEQLMFPCSDHQLFMALPYLSTMSAAKENFQHYS